MVKVVTTWCGIFLLVCMVTSCATPRERYIQALSKRMGGDSRAYYDGMLALAHDSPDTRAGRRARAVLQSSDVWWSLASGGALAAFFRPGSKGQLAANARDEVRSSLRTLYLAHQACRARSGHYCSDPQLFEGLISQSSHFVYFVGGRVAFGGGGSEDSQGLRLHAVITMDAMGIHPEIRDDGFLILGIGNLDADPTLDMWSIDDKGVLIHLVDDGV